MNRCPKCQGFVYVGYDGTRCLNCGCDPTMMLRQGSKCQWTNCFILLAEPGFCEQHQRSRVRLDKSKADRMKEYRERKRLSVKRCRAKKRANQQAKQEAA